MEFYHGRSNGLDVLMVEYLEMEILVVVQKDLANAVTITLRDHSGTGEARGSLTIDYDKDYCSLNEQKLYDYWQNYKGHIPYHELIYFMANNMDLEIL